LSEEDTNFISVQPILSYPREARPGKTYLMTVDLRVQDTDFSWPYEEEELPVYCFVDASPSFDSEPLGDATILLHRFGGTYGPAEFLLTATGRPQKVDIQVTLTSVYGKPIEVIVIDDVRILKEEEVGETSTTTADTELITIPAPVGKTQPRSGAAELDTPERPRSRASDEDESTSVYRINLKSTKVVVAIAQLAGPFPDGKHKTVINDRETLAWKSLEDMRSRLEKVYTILDELSEVPLKPDIVVFPEYSFPVQRALAELQKKADQYNFIIVGGSDSIWQPNSVKIFNQSPIIIPAREGPLWVTKRAVSQWEEGLVDEPADVTQPVLTWETDGQEFWISTHICLDFSLAPDDFKNGGGLFLVPMTSPDVMSFLGWGDALLRLPGGTATVLCNSVGGFAKGQSGVVAVNPGGKPFQAAFEMSTTREQVAVLELNLQHLSPPRKTPTRQRVYPLMRRYLYDLETILGGIQFHQVASPDEGIKKRGVINPEIFSAVLRKKMRMAFLKVSNYAEAEDRLRGKDYEALAILGKEDLMVTHLADDRYDMIFDVTQAITWIGINNDTITMQNLHELNYDNFPHFRVDAYYKVLGVPVDEDARRAFSSRDKVFPNFSDIEKIFKLGERWDHPDVTDEERKRCLANKWILNIRETSPGDTNAVMTISLQLARGQLKPHLLAKFEERVVPELVESPHVTSLYRGSSPGLGIDYVARLNCDLGSISSLQSRLYELALLERLRIDVTTFIVHKKLSRLSLSKSILVTTLSRDKAYRDQRIIPHLTDDERVRLTYQSEKEQLQFIDLFRPIDEGIEKINHLGLNADEKRLFRRKLTRGLLNKDFDSLREVHDRLQAQVEIFLSTFIKDFITEEDFKQLKAKESVQSQRTKTQLNYSEKVRLVARHIEEARHGVDFLTAFLRDFLNEEDFTHLKDREHVPLQKSKTQLSDQEKIMIAARYIEEIGFLSSLKELNSTFKVRNAFAHGDAEQRITLEEFTTTIVNYCNFIHAWDKSLESFSEGHS
jgi:hypothetical protein